MIILSTRSSSILKPLRASRLDIESEKTINLVSTQPVEILAMILRHLVCWASADIQVKFYGDSLRETTPSGAINARGVAKYSDFGSIEGYISETVHERR